MKKKKLLTKWQWFRVMREVKPDITLKEFHAAWREFVVERKRA